MIRINLESQFSKRKLEIIQQICVISEMCNDVYIVSHFEWICSYISTTNLAMYSIDVEFFTIYLA